MEKIASEFNAVSPNNVHRDFLSLKKAFLNIKKNVRKEVAEEKMDIIKTGGGCAKQTRNPLQQMALATMNNKTTFGHHNEFDGDNVASCHIQSSCRERPSRPTENGLAV